MSAAEFVVQRSHQTNRTSPARWVRSHVRRHWWLVPIILLGAFGNAVLAGVVPLLIGRAFDLIGRLSKVPNPDLAGLAYLAWLVVLSQLVRGVLQLGRNFGTELLGQRLERDARDELYASLLGKSMAFHGFQPVGDTMARATNDVREVNLMLNPGLNLVVGSANFLIIPILFAPRYNPTLILAPLIFIVLYFWSLRRYLATLAPITRDAREAFGRMNTQLTEAIDGIEVVKGAAQEAHEIERFTTEADAYCGAAIRQGEQEARFVPLLLLGLTMSLGFLQALLLFRQGLLTVGQVVGYMGLLQLFGFPTYTSLFAYSQVSSGLASAERILELINSETLLDENRAGHVGTLSGEIAFDAVDFGYGPGQNALSDVSFRVAPGQTVALVGQTGAGKTTVARLINRTYDATGGAVRVDGVDVRDWNLESLRQQIAIIEQDLFLFSRSIAENIAFGCPDADRPAIEAAARDAQAHDFIMAFPEGYDTVIGERGVTLSGGQRQRIAIARALVTDPRILILDDSTSAIDSATEDQIQRAIRRAATGRTTVLITHRLSQIRWADLVVVLRGGRVEGCGRHEELLATCEPYRRIFVRLERSLGPAGGPPSGSSDADAGGASSADDAEAVA
jgi:ATP-binding cassette subfamily B protein